MFRIISLNLALLSGIMMSVCVSGCGQKSAAENPAAQQAPARDVNQAEEILAQALSSEDPALRALALEAYDDLGKQPPVGPLSLLLSDERPSLRFMAVRLKADQATRDQVGFFDHLAASDPDPSVRLVAVYGMSTLGDHSRIEALAAGLQSGNPTVRRNAAMLLGYLKNSSAVPMLRLRLRDSDAMVQLNAAEAMARLGDNSGLDIIRELARQHGHPYQVYAFLALGRVGVPERDIPLLRQLVQLRENRSQQVYSQGGLIAAFGARAMLGDYLQTYVLGELIIGSGPKGETLAAPERAFALQMLARSSYAPAWREVLKAMDDKDPYVRTSAAWALQSYNVPRAEQIIRSINEGPRPKALPDDEVLVRPESPQLGPAGEIQGGPGSRLDGRASQRSN